MSDSAPHHRDPRSANWTTPELEALFRACKDNPLIALGYNGTDSRSRQRRHAFYADIAQRVSSLGIAARDGHAAQRKFVEALKKARMTAQRLLSSGTPLDETLATAMQQVPHVELLGPVLRIAVTATAPGRDTFAPPASVAETSTGSASDLQPSSELSASEHATTSQSAASTSASLAAGEHLMAASGAYPQDFPIAEALDELSLQSTSTEGGADIWGGSQAVPLQQIPVERAEGDTSGVAAEAAAPAAAAAAPAAAHEVPEPHRGGGGGGGEGGGDQTPDAAAAGEGGANGDEDDGVALRPRARGPHGRRPLPSHVSGLWAQIAQDFTDSRNAFQENMNQLRHTLVLESTSLQTVVRGQLDDIVNHLSEIGNSQSRMTSTLTNVERNLCLLTDRLLRELDQGGGGVGRGRGQGRGRGRGGSVAPEQAPTQQVQRPATQQAAHPATQAAGGSEGAAAAADLPVPTGRARSQRRAPAGSRSISSPALPTKRARR